ncbi:MAG: adenosylcobalamin-dependent ribonucleoside-diphosphate reductase, partial [Phycisphaerae bacterium]
ADASAAHVVVNPRNGDRFVIPKDAEIASYDLHTLIPVAPGKDPVVDVAVYTMGDIWQIIVKHAWQTGEPGVVFIDRINQANPTPLVGRIEATNPCGEQPLLPYEACNLGSVNLNKFIRRAGTADAQVDWEGLRETVHDSVRFLDDVIDANRYPLPEIEEMCKANRKIGLGIMGFADALYSLGVAYNSDEGLEWGERFMKFVNDEAHRASELLAEDRGCFPNWKGSTWDTVQGRRMRNACSTTVAPTGTISIIAGCSCGIEPLFGLVFYRNVLKGQDRSERPMVEMNPVFERAVRDQGILSEGMMDRIATDGTLANLEAIPDELRRVFVCAHDVSPEWHVNMQAAFQRHCDSSISKTINFPNSATMDEVASIYEMSYQAGCKGVTIYRDGCRQGQPMSREKGTGAEQGGQQAKSTSAPPMLDPVELADIASAVRTRQMTPFGNMHVQITVDPHSERELEVFAQLGKGGDLANSDLEAICRMVSLWLRSGGALQHVVRQLKGIGSSLQLSTKEGKIMSLGDALARALQKYERAKSRFGLKNLLLGEFDPVELDREVASAKRPNGTNGHGPATLKGRNGNGHSNPKRHGGNEHPPSAMDAGGGRSAFEEHYKVVCPECKAVLIFTEGCTKCVSCGFAAC